MSPEEIAKHTATMIAALRNEADAHARGDQFVYRLITDPRVIAAGVSAYLASCLRER